MSMVPRRRWLTVALGAAVVAALAAVGVWWKWRSAAHEQPPPDEPPPRVPAADPRVTYDGPFLNVRPEVRYVGDEQCVGCHDDIIATYRNHPMARTLAPIEAMATAYPDDKAHNNPFDAKGTRFTIDRQGGRVLHRRARVDEAGRPLAEQVFDVRYAIGSGKHGSSYLAVHDDVLVQTPISWFTQKQIWDLSPGFDDTQVTGRAVPGKCMFCHANRAAFREGSVNRLAPAGLDGHGIGCERCHGPAELHLRRLARHEKVHGKADYTIVNPKYLEPARREAVCQQCHLQGETRVPRRGQHAEDFRPGLPLESVLTVLVHVTGEGANQKAVNHVEQMYQSACFRRSPADAKLGCTSCHNPHQTVAPSERATYYRGRCLTCHQPESCTAPAADRRAKGDGCVACHMPPYGTSNIAHTASTDHRIPRRPEPPGPEAPEGPRLDLPNHFWPGLPLLPFHREGLDPADPELRRDLAVGVMGLAMQSRGGRSQYADRMLQYLEVALRRDPDDGDAQEAKANALMATGRAAAGLATVEALLAREPDRETALKSAVLMATQLKDSDKAITYARRCRDANPSKPDYRAGLARFLVGAGRWDEAAPEAEAWARLDPCSVPARWLHVRCLLRQGKKSEAHDEFRVIEAMKPPDMTELRARFADEAR
jgi:hypothetical protein